MANVIVSLLSIFIGILAWGNNFFPYTLPTILLIAVLLLWNLSTNRFYLGLAIALYHFAAARSLIFGLNVVLGYNMLQGILILAVGSSLMFLVGVISYQKKNKLLQIFLILLLWNLPPFALVGWANPIVSAGGIFPNFGWFGYFCLILLLWFLQHNLKKYLILFISFVAIGAVAAIPIKYRSDYIYPINTKFDNIQNDIASVYGKNFSQMAMIKNIYSTTKQTKFLLPEISIGCIDPIMEKKWVDFLTQNKEIDYVIASAYKCGIEELENTTILINKNGFNVLYKQRLPMILGMYNPFKEHGFKQNISSKATNVVDDKKIGFLICYETVLQWTYYQLFVGNVDLIISQNSTPWDKTKQIKLIQEQMLYANARLFNKKYIGVWND